MVNTPDTSPTTKISLAGFRMPRRKTKILGKQLRTQATTFDPERLFTEIGWAKQEKEAADKMVQEADEAVLQQLRAMTQKETELAAAKESMAKLEGEMKELKKVLSETETSRKGVADMLRETAAALEKERETAMVLTAERKELATALRNAHNDTH